jgi:DNA primase
MIDQATVERIIDTAQIVDVVEDFVRLKKRGVNYLGLCPFHGEKTPSFTVSPAKNIFKCFGCGKGGNAVSFIMEYEHLSYYEALRHLAKRYNIEIVERELSSNEIQQKNDTESMLVVNEFAQKYFSDLLHNHKEGTSVGLSYFTERAFREDIIEKFQLGYSLEQRDAFTQAALKKGFKLDYLIKTGLSIKGENNNFDRFSGRVMFPIHSLSGKIIGFGGRVLKTDKKTAKYLNSPESEIYHKSKVLYGLFQARTAIVQVDTCYLVEGYTDVISMHQAGIHNVVASSGTSLTVDQIRLIKRFTSNITILYDGDSAGIKASIRGIDMVLEEGLNVKVLLLPDGEDPDSYSKKHNASEVIDFIEKNKTDFIHFKSRLLLQDASDDPFKKANAISDIVNSISVIPDIIIRSVYIKECSNLLEVDEQVLYSQINRIRRKNAEDKYAGPSYYENKEQTVKIQVPPAPITSEIENTEKTIVKHLVKYGNLEFQKYTDEAGVEHSQSVAAYITAEIKNDELIIANPLCKQIFEEIDLIISQGRMIEERSFLNHEDPVISQFMVDLLSSPYHLSKIWKKKNTYIEPESSKIQKTVSDTIMRYKILKVNHALKELQINLLQHQGNDDLEEIEELQKRYMLLTDLKKQLNIYSSIIM